MMRPWLMAWTTSEAPRPCRRRRRRPARSTSSCRPPRCRGRRASRPTPPPGRACTTCRKPMAISTRSAGRTNSVPGISFISQPFGAGEPIRPVAAADLLDAAVVAAKLLGQDAPAALAALFLRRRSAHDLRPVAARGSRRCCASGGLGRISNCVTEMAPWRIDVPTQSLPVSPPPTTITCLPLAGAGHRRRAVSAGRSSPATRRFCWLRKSMARCTPRSSAPVTFSGRGWPAPMHRQTASNWLRSSAAGDVAADIHARLEPHALGGHLLQAAVDDPASPA